MDEDFRKMSPDVYFEVYRDLVSHYDDMEEHFLPISVESTEDWIGAYYQNSHTFTSRKLDEDLCLDSEQTFEIIKFLVYYYLINYNKTYRITTFKKCLNDFAFLCAKEIYAEVFETEFGQEIKTREEIQQELEDDTESDEEPLPSQQ